MERQATCKERWAKEKNSTFTELRRLIRLEEKGIESDPEGVLNEYGLSFDYVEPGTFGGQKEGYWRYQLSWGGPSNEIWFYSSGPQFKPYRIEYTFKDWFDGYSRALVGRDLETAEWLWDWLDGSIAHAYEEAVCAE